MEFQAKCQENIRDKKIKFLSQNMQPKYENFTSKISFF